MMFKKFAGVTLALLLMTTAAYAQTGDEIIAKHVKAIGGEAKLKSINTLVSVGTFSMPAYNLNMDFTMTQKRPNMMKMVSEMPGGMQVVQSVKGDTCWTINSFAGISEPTAVTDAETVDQMKMQADIDGFFLNRKARGIATKFVGLNDIDGEKLNQVDITYKNGRVVSACFDPASGLLRRTSTKVSQMGQEFEAVAYYSDYRVVNGIMFAFRVDQTVGPQAIAIESKEIKVNSKVDDSLFDMPKVEKKPEAKPGAPAKKP